MNRDKIIYLREFFVTQMNHWTMFPLFLLIISLVKNLTVFDEPNPLLWLCLGLVPFVFYFFRLWFQRFVLFCLAHFAVLVLLYFVLPCGSTASKVLYVLFAAGYVVYSFMLRLNSSDFQDGRFLMPVAVALSAVSFYLLHYQGYYEWDNYYISVLIAVFGMYFLSSYLESYMNFLLVNESSTGHIPEKEIFTSGSLMAFFYVAFAMVVLFATSHIGWLRTLLHVIKELLFMILRFLFSLFPESHPDIPEIEESQQMSGEVMELPPPEEPFFLWQLLEVIAVIAILAGMMYALYRFLKYAIAFVRSRMAYRLKKEEYTASERVVDIREKCTTEHKSREKKRDLFGFLSPQERIRRLYKKHITASKRLRDIVPGNHDSDPALLTAREWGILLEEDNMPEIYEKARYSGETCTADDYRRMRQACKQKVL